MSLLKPEKQTQKVTVKRRYLSPSDYVARAIKIAGSQAELARWIGSTQQRVSQMLSTGRVSAKLAVRIEHVTHHQIKALSLCPTLLDGDGYD